MRRAYVAVLIGLTMAFFIGCDQDQPQTERVREEVIDNFFRVTEEYNRALEAELACTTKTDRERTHLTRFHTYNYLYRSYYDLTHKEREKMFSDPRCINLPEGVAVGMGEHTTSLLGKSVITGDPQEDFRTFIVKSFNEYGYLESFAMDGEESVKIFEETYARLLGDYPRDCP